MISSAYAVVHFNCAHENCMRNDTAIFGNMAGAFRNKDLNMFESLSKEYIWAFLKKNFHLFFFDDTTELVFCEIHRKEYE